MGQLAIAVRQELWIQLSLLTKIQTSKVFERVRELRNIFSGSSMKKTVQYIQFRNTQRVRRD
jgi:hypothetical protein